MTENIDPNDIEDCQKQVFDLEAEVRELRAALERARALETKLRDRGKAPHLYSENERVMFIVMADELAALLAAPAGGEQP